MIENIKRLQIISQLISIGDIELVSSQIEKLDNLNNDIIKIIESLKNKEYGNTVTLINEYISKNQGIIEYVDNELEALKFEILNLEEEVGELETRKIEVEKILHDFELKHHKELGDLIFKILKIKRDKSKNDYENDIEDDIKKKNFYDSNSDYEEYSGAYEDSKKQKSKILNEEELLELKKKFRTACHFCHPDKFNDDMKEEAQKVFIELKNAYEENDLEKVSNLLVSLENGKLSANIKDFNIDKKKEIILKIQELKFKKIELEKSLFNLETSQTYKEISNIQDWDEYFKVKKEKLINELLKLE